MYYLCTVHSLVNFSSLQSDDTWLANVQTLMDLTGDVPLGLYETPVPKVRWVHPQHISFYTHLHSPFLPTHTHTLLTPSPSPPSSPLHVRSLTPEMMTWIARSGRFVFHKDTSLDLQTMVKKINAVKAIPDTPLM